MKERYIHSAQDMIDRTYSKTIEDRDMSVLCALEEQIICRIRRAECRRARMHAMAFVVAVGCSFAVAYPATLSLIEGVTDSGLLEYMSLIMTDGTSLVTYWKEFLLTVLELIPVLSLAALLTVVAVLVWTIPRGVREVKNSFVSA